MPRWITSILDHIPSFWLLLLRKTTNIGHKEGVQCIHIYDYHGVAVGIQDITFMPIPICEESNTDKMKKRLRLYLKEIVIYNNLQVY